MIDGGGSDTWMHHGSDSLADILRNAQRVTLTGQTHTVAPEILAPAIAQFLQRRFPRAGQSKQDSP